MKPIRRKIKTLPYTFVIGWTSLDKFYYGVDFRKGCSPSDLWVTYFSKSKLVSGFRKLNGEPDLIEIRRNFYTKEKATKWFERIVSRANLSQSDRWLNSRLSPTAYVGNITNCPVCNTSVGKKQKYCSKACKHVGQADTMSGRLMSDETKDKLRETTRAAYATGIPQQKIRDTFQAKYGVSNAGQLPTHHLAIDRMKATYATGSPQAKSRATFQEKYGVDNAMELPGMREWFSKTVSMTMLGEDVYSKISSHEWWKDNYKRGMTFVKVGELAGTSSGVAHSWATRLGISHKMIKENHVERV